MAGDSLLRLAREWFDEGTVTRVFEPLVADWQRECDGLAGTRRWICRVRGITAFTTTFLIAFGRDLRRPLPVGLGGTAWLCMDAFIGLSALLYLLPFLWSPDDRAVGIGLRLPHVATIAIPVALVPVTILLLAKSRWEPFDVRRALLRIVLLYVGVMFVLTGWVTPNANQTWREARVAATEASGRSHPSVVKRGVRELTFPELLAAGVPNDAVPMTDRSRSFELQTRLRITVMPLCLFAVGLTTSSRRAPILRSLFWWAVSALVWMFSLAVVRASYVALGETRRALPWIPVITLLLVALAIRWSSRALERRREVAS